MEVTDSGTGRRSQFTNVIWHLEDAMRFHRSLRNSSLRLLLGMRFAMAIDDSWLYFAFFFPLPDVTGRYWERQNSSPKDFFKIVNNCRELLYKTLHTSYPFSYSLTWKVLLHCIQNWQNYAAFNYGRLTFWRYQNLSHTNSVQDKRKHHKCEPFLSYSQCSKCLPFSIISQPLSQTRDSSVLRKIFPRFLQCDFLIQRRIWLGMMKLSKRLHALLPIHDICRRFKYEKLGDMCCVRRAPCISLKLPLRPAAVGCSLQ